MLDSYMVSAPGAFAAASAELSAQHPRLPGEGQGHRTHFGGTKPPLRRPLEIRICAPSSCSFIVPVITILHRQAGRTARRLAEQSHAARRVASALPIAMSEIACSGGGAPAEPGRQLAGIAGQIDINDPRNGAE